jgi:hypothetical protein
MKKITLQIIALLFVMSSWGQTVVYIDEDFEDTDITGGNVTLASGFGKYNYTSDIAGGQENWAAGLTPAEKTNAVSVNTATGSGSYDASNVGGQQALLVHAGNLANADRGIYFTGLNLTGQSIIYFEFEIWGAPSAGDTDIPVTLTGWKINFNHGYTGTALDITESYFSAGANVTRDIPFNITIGATTTTNQTTFDIIDGQWIKISGSFDLSGKTIGDFGAFQIETDTGGFVSAGVPIYAIDNVFVANVATLSHESFKLNSDIKIYPNPVNNVLKIKSKNNLDVSNLSLVNVLGKTVYSTKSIQDIDVSNFAKGLYVLKITSKEQGVLSKKVIIE